MSNFEIDTAPANGLILGHIPWSDGQVRVHIAEYMES